MLIQDLGPYTHMKLDKRAAPPKASDASNDVQRQMHDSFKICGHLLTCRIGYLGSPGPHEFPVCGNQEGFTVQ